MRGRQAGPRGRGAALLPLCGAAAAVLLFLAQGPMGWVGCSQQHPGRRGGGGRCGPVARGAVEVHEIRSRIKEDQGKSWIELNIGQMGHTANITWARHLEGARRDRLVDVSQRRRRLGEVHSPRRRGRGLGHHGLHVGREQNNSRLAPSPKRSWSAAGSRPKKRPGRTARSRPPGAPRSRPSASRPRTCRLRWSRSSGATARSTGRPSRRCGPTTSEASGVPAACPPRSPGSGPPLPPSFAPLLLSCRGAPERLCSRAARPSSSPMPCSSWRL
ncbi:unnamed protein product [Prorocentrum cordatum]|uniref:Uncharacterized protein n=2 Tax=Prorocentrum cordatum TaxID=2364126 RepID=A0ABN9SH01_9DINO|nr:unnamed protein product [Polarella glacialis]